MASRIALNQLAGQAVNGLDSVVDAVSFVRAGSPESDAVAKLLRELNGTLNELAGALYEHANASTR